MPSVAVVVPFFGKWDEWAHLFFETVRRNASIDFLVFTDCDPGPLSAPNVQVITLSFAEYVRMVQERLQIPFAPKNAYKLCDLRPLFGTLHEAEFRGFDFYGWCDVDLLLGDVRAFYTDDILARYDVLSTHEHRISGHFALFRNTSHNRDMYRRIYAWQEALARPEFVGIDEHGITNAYLMTWVDRLNEKFKLEITNSATRALSRRRRRRLHMMEQYTTPFVSRPWLDGSKDSGQPDTWFYRDGVITNSRDGDRNFIYLHFMNFRSSRWRHDGTPAPWTSLDRVCGATVEDMVDGIVINAQGIWPMTGASEEGTSKDPSPGSGT